MPDQTVNVSFDPTATPQFTFDPSSVTMTSAGKIILIQKPANATWAFGSPGALVKNDSLNEFSASRQGNGQSVQINDLFLDPKGTSVTYNYDCTVTLNNQTYTSPDPEIINDPGSSDP